MNQPPRVSRRAFIHRGALISGGLLIGFQVGRRRVGAADAQSAEVAAFAPNAFLQISRDGTITVFSKFSELGQGIHTTMAMCVAEELDADWNQITVADAPNGPEYAHAWWGFQMTGGSSSTSTSFQQMREAGALARMLLVAAAAQRWGVDVATLRTENSTVIARNGRIASYGSLVETAAQLPAPAGVPLKDPTAFKIIGRDTHRIDSRVKITGQAVFGIDVVVPGMLTAIFLRCPVFGGHMLSFDANAAAAIPGVRHVAAMAGGVIVIASDFWTAKRAADATTVEWDPGSFATLSTASQRDEYLGLIAGPGVEANASGNPEAEFEAAPMKIEAEFDLPYLAHACMEPVNATAHVKSDGTVEVWAPTQVQDADRAAAARVAGVPLERVTLHTTYVGGAFGRKSGEDFVPLAVEASMLARAAVRLLWRREDDMRGGYYRPRTIIRSKLGLDATGKPVAWETRVVSQSIIKHTVFRRIYQNGLDGSQTAAFTHLSYPVPHVRTTWHEAPEGVPVLAWRDPAPIIGSFAIETMMDDAARLAGRDPIDYRLALIGDKPRCAAVLRRLRDVSGWGRAATGRALGVAFKDSGSTIVGEVAEVSIGADHTIKVYRVTVVVDCGLAVNPDGVRAQMMSGVVYGLSAALAEEITLADGRVVQSNFHDYPILRLPDAPVVDVHIIDSSAPPGGVGEPSTPLIAPAVGNAIFAATGKRLRNLPFRLT